MKALWFFGQTKDLSHREDVAEPLLRNADSVKIKVAYSGVCGSDFHFMQGEMGKFNPKQDGVIMGHEFSGTVVEVGKDAQAKFLIGDMVSVDPNSCCGNCDWHKDGQTNFCEKNYTIGVKQDGGWAAYCVVPQHQVYKLPETLTLEQGALAEPCSCVIRGWKQLGKLPPKDARVLVQGAGIIGCLFCTLLRYHGFVNIAVTDIQEQRRKLCAGLGLGLDVVHPQELDLKLATKDVDKEGFHLIIDCTGNTVAAQKSFDYARRGAKICIFGCCPAGKKITIEPFQIYWKELTIIGAFINPLCFDEAIELMVDLAAKGMLDYDKLGIQTFPLKDYKEALACLRSGNATKVVFCMDE